MNAYSKRLWGGIGLAVVLVIAALLALRPLTGIASAVEPARATAIGQVAPDQRELVYRQQIEQAASLLQERQATYQAQIEELTRRVQDGQAQLANLDTQEVALQQQLAQVQNARGVQLDSYTSQLAAAKEAYQARFDQLSAQLREADAKLAEANAILGR